MSEFISPDGPRRLLTDLCRLVAERASVEEELNVGVAARSEAAEKEHQAALDQLKNRHEADKAATETEYAATRSAVAAKFDTQHGALESEYESIRAEALADFNADETAAQQTLHDANWEAMEASDLARGGLNLPIKEIIAGLESRWHDLETIHQQAVELLRRRGHLEGLPEAEPTGVLLEKRPGRRFCHAMEQAQTQSRALARQVLPQLFRGVRPFGIILLLWALAAIPSIALFNNWQDWRWAAVSAAFAVVVGGIGLIVTYRIAKRKSIEAYIALRRTLLEAGLPNPAVLEAAKVECQRLDATIVARHRTATQKAEQEFNATIARITQRKANELRRAEESYPNRIAELAAWRDRTLKEIEAKYPPKLRTLDEQYAAELERLQERYGRTSQESHDRTWREWVAMADRWRAGIERFRATSEELQSACHDLCPDWNTDDWRRWAPPVSIPPIIRLGGAQVRLADIESGVPEDEQLRPAQAEFAMPVVLPYPRRSLLLLKAAGPGRARAVDVMQTAMLRLLTAMPPSKVRFTIIDPVGLGDNFSAFMHLADYDEQLVASRIWTDSAHIEQRLADLTKHMENVIQVYLRKEFHSIEEYNAFAGEMAEPYRVLVVANFPANFSEAAAHRIKSIVASGARCGVFVLLSVDSKLPLPRNFQLPDLEAEGLTLRWAEGQFVWEHPDFGPLPVEVDAPPPPEQFKEIVRTVGSAARDTGRVEVPFSSIVPAAADWWTTESRGGIDVPLGKAGAMKLQHLALGSGTSQHVLISGKTGSGKSTLLHVLVTNLALRYSPDEVELYLIDFKKGVEFKAYARCGLPHARVVAIESEREFGLSVLQRLDAELRTRGDMFRKRGMQDLKTYRAAEPGARLPRILLIIDEFQELFTEDDRIAQEAALLLDRLVRQGRAFGIHVLLGSQTLGGAYTLARSTIGQMAVRIALQCSESDAHLILSEDNTAARLLTRPGEAIYNDANGLYEGNHPFQVVWLSDNERDDYLDRVGQLARQRQIVTPPSIVFEGNVLADLGDNPNLKQLIEATAWPPSSPAVQAWLGSAVAIKDPTAATFLRQNASNLLMVGHREEAALGVLASAFVSLAAQYCPTSPLLSGEGPASTSPRPLGEGPGVRAAEDQTASSLSPHPNPLPKGDGTSDLLTGDGTGARFYILDGMRSDAPEVGFWKRLAAVAPQAVTLAGVREANDVIAEIAKDLAVRQEEKKENAPAVYLFVYNLARFRDLRKEEEFGFSSNDDDKPASAAKQFAAILREGAALGIHALIWCDTYSNVTRMLDRQCLRDFEMRVLFQMNAGDSSSLMDAPDASRLGVHRAIFYDEGQGLTEKFRPYGLPSNEWLAWVKKQLHGRGETGGQ